MKTDFGVYGFSYVDNLWTKEDMTIYTGAALSETMKPITMLSLCSNHRTKDEELLARGDEHIIDYLDSLKMEIRNKNLNNLLNGE